jgi:hypothetical protein
MNVKRLLLHLRSGNDRQRRSASYKLGKLRDPTVVPHLIRAYTDTDAGVRQNVINALETIGTTKALDFLNQVQPGAIRTSSSRLIQLAMISKKAAWLLIVGGILAGLFALGVSLEYIGASAYFGVAAAVGLGCGFVFRFLSEAIYTIIDIESNTRRVAEALEKLVDVQAGLGEAGFTPIEKALK